jgi:hypothetical protein
MQIGLVTDDVPAAFENAVAARAVAVAEPAPKPWGQIVGYVRDDNGFMVELCTPMARANACATPRVPAPLAFGCVDHNFASTTDMDGWDGAEAGCLFRTAPRAKRMARWVPCHGLGFWQRWLSRFCSRRARPLIRRRVSATAP